MGNDVTFEYRRENGGGRKILYDTPEGVCLLWLCCFRISDFDPGSSFSRLRVSVKTASSNLDDGIERLRAEFGDIQGIANLAYELKTMLDDMEPGNVSIEFEDAWYVENRLLGFIVHALTGFLIPEYKTYFDPTECLEWKSSLAPPGPSGVVTWVGALQRLCIPWTGGCEIPESLVEAYDCAGLDAFDWEIHCNKNPRAYLLGT